MDLIKVVYCDCLTTAVNIICLLHPVDVEKALVSVVLHTVC